MSFHFLKICYSKNYTFHLLIVIVHSLKPFSLSDFIKSQKQLNNQNSSTILSKGVFDYTFDNLVLE